MQKMEEEINYSTVVFKDRPAKEKNEVLTDAKAPKGSAATEPADGAAAGAGRTRALVACLGILCVLLAASIGAIVYINVAMDAQNADLSELKAENRRLVAERSVMQREAEELSSVTGSLNWTLEVILDFNSFPVNEFCPEKTCRPCRTGWTEFQEKCYLFYNQRPRWLTWSEGRQFCQDRSADLVVIDSLEEQEFVSRNIKFYYSKNHGYWLGLRKDEGQTWRWIDGRVDTLGFFKDDPEDPDPFALIVAGRNLTANWDKADFMYNKFICEADVLIRSR